MGLFQNFGTPVATRVRPGELIRAAADAVDDEGVVGDVQVIEGFQQFADVTVMLNRAVGVIISGHAALALHRAQMNKRAHVGDVHTDKERLAGLGLFCDERLAPLEAIGRAITGCAIEFECQFSGLLLIDCSLQRTINSSFCRSQGDNRCLLCG